MNRMIVCVLTIGAIALAGGTTYAAGDVAAGKAKSASCDRCHGPAGQGTAMARKIAGMDPTAFVQAVDDYKSGKRSNAMMKAAASSLSAQDEANLAAYYASPK
jgi:cytochrome c553